MLYMQGLFVPFACIGSGDPVRVFTSVHNEYTGYTLKHLLLRHMYNLSLPNLCATCSSLVTLRLPTVDPYSAEVPGEMRSHTVLCDGLCACVDASRTVFWDRSHIQGSGD